MTFRAVTANSGSHQNMTSSNYATVTYVKADGSSGTTHVYDGHSSTVSAKPSSSYSYSSYSSSGTSQHRWDRVGPSGGTTPSSGSQTVTKNYYEKWWCRVTLNGTDSSHQVSVSWVRRFVRCGKRSVMQQHHHWHSAAHDERPAQLDGQQRPR